MKSNLPVTSRSRALWLVLAITAIGLALDVQAQNTLYWRGESDNGDWYTAGDGDNDHWWRSPGGPNLNAPDNNAILIFDNDTETALNNNGAWAGYRIIFESNCNLDRTLNGNAITFYDYGGAQPKIENQSSSSHSIHVDITGDNTGDPMELNPVAGDLTLGGNINNNGSDIQVWGDNMHYLTLNGVISGSGKLIVEEQTYVYLGGTNTFTGNIEINEGAVSLVGDPVTVGAGTVYIGNGGAMATLAELALDDADGGFTFQRNFVVNDGNVGLRQLNATATSGTNLLTGTITLNGPLTCSGTEGGCMLITNTISGPKRFKVTGDQAIFKISGNNTYEGGTEVGGAWLLALSASACSTGAVLVNTVGGGLGGHGVVRGPVTVQTTGRLRPGEGADRATLTITNSLTLLAGSTNWFDLSAASAASDRIDMQGGGTLTLSGAVEFVGAPFGGATYVIVTNIAARTGAYAATNGLAAGWNLFYGADYIYVKEAPTAVDLAEFTVAEERIVAVKWVTASETSTLGFNLYRKDVNGVWIKVNADLVPAQGWPNGGIGGSYRVVDSGAIPGETYTYKLVEIETDGTEIEYGPFVRQATEVTAALEMSRPLPAGPDGVAVRWVSRAGERYTVLRASNLADGFTPLATGIVATPPENIYIDSSAGTDAAYYSIRAE